MNQRDPTSRCSYTIGELARHSGVPARRIRFYADAGLLSPDRTEAGYRIFGARDLVVLDLIRSLREAGASLPAIRSVLSQNETLADLLAVRLTEIEAGIRRQKALAATLRLALAGGAPTIRDLERISQMIGHTRAQRHATATAVLDGIAAGVAFDPRWHETMLDMIAAPDLPDEPSPEQVDAWLALNEALVDERVQRMLRAQAVDTGRTLEFLRVRDDPDAWRAREGEILDEARAAMCRDVGTGSEEGQRLADAYIAFMAWNRGLPDDEAFRTYIAGLWTDNAPLERFWDYVEAFNGRNRIKSAEYDWLARATAERLREDC